MTHSSTPHRLASLVALVAASVLLSCTGDGLLIPLAPPTLTTVTTGGAIQGANATLTIAGTGFVPKATLVDVSGPGITVSNVDVTSSTSLIASLDVAAGAALGQRTVTVTTAGGTSGEMTFVVNPPAPTLTSVTPSVGLAGATTSIALAGTNFVVGATSVAVSGANVTVQNVSVGSATALTADLVVDSTAVLGARSITVTTAGGTTGAQTFTINAQPPTLSALSAPIGVTGTTINETLTGTNFITGATTVAVSGTGVTTSNVDVTSTTSLTVDVSIDSAATLGARNVTVTTSGGTSAAQTLTVNPIAGTLTSVTPAAGVQGTTINVTLTGTTFVPGATAVAVSGTGVTSGNVNVTSATSLTVDLTIAANAPLGARDITVTTAGGTSGARTFTVNPPVPTLTSLTPAVGVQGATSVGVALAGTNFVAGATTVAISGAGVTASNVNVTSATSLTVDLTVTAGAALGSRSVTVTTAGGTSGAQTLTINPPAPTLASLSLTQGAQGGTQSITLTGTNFQSGATTVSVSGSNVTVSNVSVTSGTTLTADFAPAATATLGARTVTVTTAGGTSGPQTFTVVVPPTISAFNSLATHLGAAQPARLRWTTSNAAACSINNGVGTVSSCNDSIFVTPGTTKTYTLSASSAGVTVTANFQLFANEAGRFVYWTSPASAAGTRVHQASMDAATGDLTAIGSGTVTSGNTPDGIAVDPSGSYAYVANATSNTVSMYSIDRTTGALTSRGTIASGTGPRELAVDPTGRFVYVINNNGGGTGSISRYTIDGTGLLVANGTTTLGSNSIGIAIDGTGRFLYATNRSAKSIQEFSINADGTLSSLGTVTTSGFLAYYLAADPTGQFLYLSHDTDGRYSQYRIEADGTLTLLGGGPVNIGTGTERAVCVDPTGHFAYIADFNNAILHEFSIDQSTGLLSRFTAPTLPHTLPTTQTIQQFVIDPQGKFAYATDQNNNQLLLFTIGANGVLAPVAAPLRTTAAGSGPFGIVVSR